MTSEKLRKINHDRHRSIALLSLSLLLVGACSGLIYGWPALRWQLQGDGSELSERQLGLIYTIGTWNSQAGRFFLGLARDRFGTRIVCTLSLMFVMCGLIGIAVCDPSDFISLCVSVFFIGFGSGVQFCVLPVASLFPNHVGTVMSSLSGMFQVSTLVFVALANARGTRRTLFLAYSGIIFVLAIMSATFLPRSKSFSRCDSEKRPELPNTDDEEVDALPETDDLSTDETSGDEEHGSSHPQAPLGVVVSHDDSPVSLPTVREQMMTLEYFLVNFWFSMCLVPMQYYIGIIGFQLEQVGDATGLYSNIFSYIFAGAAISAPFSGKIADEYGLGFAQGFSTSLLAASLVFLAMKGSISLQVQTVGIVLFSVGRLGIFGLYFSNLGKRFGYNNYGTLAAFGFLASAFFSLLQYPLIGLSVNGYSTAVNSGLSIGLVLLFPYFYWLHRREIQHDSATSSTKSVSSSS